MFTSRSEHRLTLRQDNVYFRLHEKAKQLDIVDSEEIHEISGHWNEIQAEVQRLEKVFHDGKSLAQLLRQPENLYINLPQPARNLSEEVIKQVEIEVKYAGYIKREKERIEVSRRQENQALPPDFDYDQVQSLRYEAREKLKKIKPENLGQASRISGVNPSDVSILGMWIKRSTEYK